MKKFLSVSCMIICFIMSGCAIGNVDDEESNVIAKNGDISIIEEEPREKETPQIPKKSTVIELGFVGKKDGIGLAELMKEEDEESCINIYHFTVAEDEGKLTEGLKNGDLNIALISLKAAEDLYDENGEIEIAATLENVADENAVCVAARKDYTERHKNAFYFFLEELEGSLEKAGDGTNDSAENAKKFGIENGEARVYDFKRINGENEKVSDMLSVDKGFYYVNPF
ncbi:MAG: hypothetical protein IJ583_02625 [Firmicutes bacterium]|nr:hypothetical protein [Bacillota bacterium]